jgi:hypothetical protein
MATNKGMKPRHPPMVESLESRTLFSAIPHFVDHVIFVKGQFRPGSGHVEYPADVTVSAANAMSASAATADFTAARMESTVADLRESTGDSQRVPWGSAGPAWWSRLESAQTSVGLIETGGSGGDDEAVSFQFVASSGQLMGYARSGFHHEDQITSSQPDLPPAPPPQPAAAAASDTPSLAQGPTAQAFPKSAAALAQVNSATPAGADQQAHDPTVGSMIAGATAPTQIATGPLKKTSVDLSNFVASEAVWTIGQAIAVGGAFDRSAGIISSAAQSVDFVQKLLISNAATWAHVADESAIRLYEEDALLWKGAAGIAAAAMLVAATIHRDRPDGRLPRRQRRNPKYLCAGETRNSGADF